ncbi:Cc8L18.2-like protein [Daphnia magna]|uniref:Cc8L18.2-like protein n=1 Tax=Daphnia magna TaxID=35525 RepID=A0A164R505_9CRUS|nr:Cc8L18.2-like protein [Daphnia magna]
MAWFPNVLYGEAVKEKIKSTGDRNLQLSLLTLAPASWTHKQISEHFGVSEYSAAQAVELKKKSGILAKPEAKTSSRRLTDDDKQRVIDFYVSDEYSRQLPGMKSVKSVKQPNGERIKVQKRLLLLNIDELHGEYKKKFKDIAGIKTIGFSAFADLRPKHVITVGSSGTHSVCVYHHNVKLMLSSIGLSKERHLLMDKVVFSVYNKTCMLSGCPNCPGSDALESFLEELIADENESISYKQWTHTDGNKLETIVAASDDFIESLVSASKEKIDHKSCVLVSNFSENYSFIIQDSMQGYYWANDQATILTFMAYIKRPDGSIFNVSIAIISDHLIHDTISVHAYLRPVLQHLMTLNPSLKSVKYFTDESGAQYTNKKNFANLCAHFEDFKLEAEWHFFASCHGKSACDGIGDDKYWYVTQIVGLDEDKREFNVIVLYPGGELGLIRGYKPTTKNYSFVTCSHKNSIYDPPH